jgi:hypothetical protein
VKTFKLGRKRQKMVPSPPLVCVEVNPGPGHGHYLTEEERYEVVFIRKYFNWSATRIAKKFKCRRQTISELLKKHETKHFVHDLPKSGRPKKVSNKERKAFKKQALAGEPATVIAKKYRTRTKRKLHEQTVRNCLKEEGLLNFIDQEVEELTQDNKVKRLEYAKLMKHYDWKPVLFSDEKTFFLGDGSKRSWQIPGKRRKREVPKYPKKLNCWGAIGYYVKSKLYFFEDNMDEVVYQEIIDEALDEKSLIYAPDCPRELRKKWKYLQDNAKAHKSSETMYVLTQIIPRNRVIAHPANSPDLNVMEDAWSYLVRKVNGTRITTLRGLKERLIKEWNDMSWNELRPSVNSMPKRIMQCKQREGERTDY